MSNLPAIRNARLIRTGTIECEIRHPEYGWVPYGAVAGVGGMQGQIYAAALPTAVDARDPTADLTLWRAAAALTDVQLLIGLVEEQWISVAEGASWRDGILPPQVVALIDMLPEGQRFGASVRALRGRRIERLDPLVEAMAAAQGKSAGELDGFFQVYSQI